VSTIVLTVFTNSVASDALFSVTRPSAPPIEISTLRPWAWTVLMPVISRACVCAPGHVLAGHGVDSPRPLRGLLD
jgi:hypothetical protein